MQCPRCGFEHQSQVNFCSSCGAIIGQGEPVVLTKTTTPQRKIPIAVKVILALLVFMAAGPVIDWLHNGLINAEKSWNEQKLQKYREAESRKSAASSRPTISLAKYELIKEDLTYARLYPSGGITNRLC